MSACHRSDNTERITMMRRDHGISLIELLVAIAIFAIIMSFVGSYFVQQTRATALSQAINEAESIARSAAELIVQDLQLAGARAVMIDGVPDYASEIHPLCRDTNRTGCVTAWTGEVGDDGILRSGVPGAVDGYTVWYRSSLDRDSPCRRVDIALLEDKRLLRADSPCPTEFAPPPEDSTAPPYELPPAEIAVDGAVVAVNVEAFDVGFLCGVGGLEDFISADDELSSLLGDPADCYGGGDDSQFVRQARVIVEVGLSRRSDVTGEMVLTATTPNLRPGIDYLRDLSNGAP